MGAKIYAISDLHLGHVNMALKRGFSNVEEHDLHIVNTWNSIIAKHDTVYILGDIASKSTDEILQSLISSLNGKKHIILGNHDRKKQMKLLFNNNVIESYDKNLTIAIDNQLIYLSHRPKNNWPMDIDGSWHIFGHRHSTFNPYGTGKSIDCGIDMWKYKPISYEQVVEIMSEVK